MDRRHRSEEEERQQEQQHAERPASAGHDAVRIVHRVEGAGGAPPEARRERRRREEAGRGARPRHRAVGASRHGASGEDALPGAGVVGGGDGGAAEVAAGAGGGVALVVVVVGVGGERRQVVGLVALAAGLDRAAVGVAGAARVVEPRLQRRRVGALLRHAEQPRRQRPPPALFHFLFFRQGA